MNKWDMLFNNLKIGTAYHAILLVSVKVLWFNLAVGVGHYPLRVHWEHSNYRPMRTVSLCHYFLIGCVNIHYARCRKLGKFE